jgi:flagellar biosynthesis/type III secretory pathway protein FliH
MAYTIKVAMFFMFLIAVIFFSNYQLKKESRIWQIAYSRGKAEQYASDVNDMKFKYAKGFLNGYNSGFKDGYTISEQVLKIKLQNMIKEYENKKKIEEFKKYKNMYLCFKMEK